MKVKKFYEYKQEPLSNDIELVELEGEDSETLDMDEFEIESIIDVIIMDEKDYDNNKSESVTTHAGIDGKNYKRGDTIYITALVRKKDSTSFNSPAKTGVLKCRIVDIYFGLQYLKKVIN